MLIVAWEMTGACNLSCTYCRASAGSLPSEGELSTGEALAFIDSLRPLSPMIILSGGEPLLRPDIYTLARHASEAGLRVALATNGTLLTPEVVGRLKESGVLRVSISLDGGSAPVHDVTRGPDSFERALEGIGCLRGEIDFQVNVTLTRRNEGEVVPVLDLAGRLGAVAVHFFFMVPTGRGREDDLLSPERQEELLHLINEESARRNIEVKVTCAPQYARITGARGAGCLAGTSFVFVSRQGDVYPCGYLPVLAGSIRDRSFPEIWESSEVLLSLRRRELEGKCGSCGHRSSCGGCRARAYALTGDYLESDPTCTLGAQ